MVTRSIPERPIDDQLLDEMADLFLRNYVGQDAWVSTRTGLAEVLQRVLIPSTVDAHCTCKLGRRASELWYADKHGHYHPDASDPAPDDYR
ncbi:hypothetical protein ACIBEJ_00390 [Nonomuraea sp. NPDC050790]|uniref:hypothetical protein n=1 Tax=Nonomuraea sp. NPDC050790 TaxID=3364371 RepID=UPI003791AB8D